MKKLLLMLIPLFSGVLKAQTIKHQQVVKYPCYTSYWNSKTLIPDSVIWVASPHAKIVGREAGFHSTGGRINQAKDYAHSGFDIGHDCDASDENGNKLDEYNSFDYANAMPEKPNLNRLVWLALENYTRKLNTHVRVKVSYRATLGTLGIDRITIPAICIKELWYNGKHERYEMPNVDSVAKHNFTFYRKK